jgi:hypothetical protein
MSMMWVRASGTEQAVAEGAGRPRLYRLAGIAAAEWLCAVTAVALGGCGLSNGPGTLFVDPGRYSAYHCNEFAARLKALSAREKELRDLMAKASEGGGGTIIGTLAYRSDYEDVLTEEKLAHQEMAEKKCDLTPGYTSDQSIR